MFEPVWEAERMCSFVTIDAMGEERPVGGSLNDPVPPLPEPAPPGATWRDSSELKYGQGVLNVSCQKFATRTESKPTVVTSWLRFW